MSTRTVGASECADIIVDPIAFDGQPAPRDGECMLCRAHRRRATADADIERLEWTSDARVAEHMRRAPALVTVPPETTVDGAAARAAARGVHHVLVTEGGQLVGVVCGCNLARHRADEPVAACMSPQVFAVDAAATLAEAAGAMEELGVGCLPVLEHERLVGLLTEAELVAAGAPHWFHRNREQRQA
ncbi:MAG TPA: CBS domain-containing protein [Polyangia bacterium]|nr:CBS domain-containing protein [Polyangia bacterium]